MVNDIIPPNPDGEIILYNNKDFWALSKFKHPTHQIIFCNDKALATLKYVEHYEIKNKQ